MQVFGCLSNSAFLREDELYDIYDTKGVMISERLSGYY